MSQSDATSRGCERCGRWPIGLGAAQIVAGGLVAAMSGRLHLIDGSWLAAYLVLIGGVAQYLMGRALRWFALPRVLPPWTLPVGWNLGNVLVIVGSLTRLPVFVDIGGVILLAVLVVHAVELVRAHRERFLAPERYRTIARIGYLVWLAGLAVSVPIGLVLAQLAAN